MTRAPAPQADLVPLHDRLRALALLRGVTVAVAAVTAAVGDLEWVASPRLVVSATLGHLFAATLVGVVHKRRRRRGLPVFGLLLILDGLAVQAVTFATGAMASPLRYLVLVQLVVVALVASYRTGLKLAIWQSLLLLTAHEAVRVGLLPDVTATSESANAFVAVIWAVVLATCTASSMNERELRRRRYEVEVLASMAKELERAVSAVAVADVVCATASTSLDTERAAVVDLRDAPAVLAGTGTAAVPAGTAGDDRLLARLRREHRALLVSAVDPATDPWLGALLPEGHHVVLLPLTVQGEVVAALVLQRPMRAGSRLEQRVLDAALRIADHAAISLSNAWLRDRLARYASTDALTGLANRRTFDEALDGAARQGRPTALLLLDLDHFKAVNDTHGHATGDVVLRAVGEVLRATVPADGLAARFGGEEFAVLLGTPADAPPLAEAVRAAIAAADTPIPVTASLGVAADGRDGPFEPTALLARADEALYAAKGRGRNRVVVAATRQRAEVVAADAAR